MPVLKKLIKVYGCLRDLIALVILTWVGAVIVKHTCIKYVASVLRGCCSDFISHIKKLLDTLYHGDVARLGFNDFVGADLHVVINQCLFHLKCRRGVRERNKIHVRLNLSQLFNLITCVHQQLIREIIKKWVWLIREPRVLELYQYTENKSCLCEIDGG